MGGSFETSPSEKSAHCQPLQLPTLMPDLYGAAKEMVEDLGWELRSEELESVKGTLVCVRKGGLLSGDSTITITLEAPEGIPATTINVRSVTDGGLASRDKKNVVEFMKPYNRRVC